jgi:chemotaxis protein MotB
VSGGGHGHGGGKRRGHEEEHEEHENHERWLVSYADMMTLLMVLFIVMFAISQVDVKKFAALKTGLASGFGAPVAMLPGSDALLDVGGAVAPDSINLAGTTAGGKSDTQGNQSQTEVRVNAEAVAALASATEKAKVAQEVKNLQDAKQKLQQALAKAGLKNKATFRFDERGLVVTIATDKVLFDSGSAALEPTGARILNSLAPTLKALPNKLSIDGHTNSIPIHTARFESNWELSSDRATGVLRHLHSRDGIPYGRMSATGYADTRPRVAVTNPKSLTVNRRVEIVILASIDNAAGRAVASLGNESGSGASEGTGAKPLGASTPLTATGEGGSGTSSAGDAQQKFADGAKQAAARLSR